MNTRAHLRGFVSVGFVVYALATLAVLAALGTVAWRVNHWCNAACEAQTKRADAAEGSIKAAQERATAMTMLWDGERQKREADAKQHEADRAARFAAVDAAANRLSPTVGRVRFAADAVGVFDAAINAGNAGIARPAGDPAKETAAASAAAADRDRVTVADVTGWAVAVIKLYAECADTVTGWQSFYEGLRFAQIRDGIH